MLPPFVYDDAAVPDNAISVFQKGRRNVEQIDQTSNFSRIALDLDLAILD